MTIFNVIQTSKVGGEILVDVTPCSDLHSAQVTMDEKIRKLLSEGKFEGLNLDAIERDQYNEGVDCGYSLNRDEMSFHIETTYDDYSENITISWKHLVTIW